jgi:glutamate racemase
MIIIEPSKAIAERVKSLLAGQGRPKPKKMGKYKFLTTGNAQGFSKVASRLLGKTVSASRIQI